MTAVISDTGPLLHLHEAGAVHLLGYLGDIQVTPTVWSELLRHVPNFQSGTIPPWLTFVKPSTDAILQAAKWVNAQVLHAGEAEALAHARDIQANLFLTDDTAARTMGESLGVEVRGSLGVVLFAVARGHLNRQEFAQIFDHLERHSTLWMSAKVKTAVKQAASRLFEAKSAS